MPLPIDDITIPPERFGEGRGDENDDELRELADSVEEFGILEPILLDEDNALIAGQRRLSAAIMCGREELEDHEYQHKEDLSPLDKKRVELMENVLRKNLTWAEEAQAIARIDALKKEEDPEWESQQTAELVGKSASTVSQSKKLSEALEENEELEKEDTLVGALNKMKREKDIEKRKKKAEKKREESGGGLRASVVPGDALTMLGEFNDESFDAIITNPPFGVDLKMARGKGPDPEVYHDDEDYVVDLLRECIPEFYRVLKPDTWLVIFFSTAKITTNKYSRELYEELKGTDHEDLAHRALGMTGWLEEYFDYVQPLPNVWAKPNKTQGQPGDPDKRLIPAYETFVLAGKGEPKLLERGRTNLFTYDAPNPSGRVHPLQMPRDLCQRLCELTVLGGELVLDPFCGSGAVGLGALDREAEFIGIELDKEYASRAQMLLDEHQYSEDGDED